ncbi:MAG: glycerol-3-phosphate 1-O-acyltransferase PlsY, partial [Atribacterota bacterium]
MTHIFIIIFSYLIGSIPFGYLVGKYLKRIDIREQGSGNIGVANSFRVMGIKCALLVLIGDCLKGFFSIILAKWLLAESIEFYLLTGLAAIIGHNWSIFLNFKGGKGIATTYGVVLTFYPYIAIIAAIIWGAIVFTTRFAALGSIISVFAMFILSFLFNTPLEFKIFVVIIFLFAIIRHHSNINRLLHKKESKITNENK